jgi:hypothetical protein
VASRLGKRRTLVANISIVVADSRGAAPTDRKSRRRRVTRCRWTIVTVAALRSLGSGLIDQSQKATAAAIQIADK